MLTLRDASAARLAARARAQGAAAGFARGQILYAVGPSPPKPGQVIGSAGPTTTARMARYLPALFTAGVRAVIGKGELHGEDMAAFAAHRAVYFAAIGGLGALLAKQISAASVVAYDDLGPEALYRARHRGVSVGRDHRPGGTQFPRDHSRPMAQIPAKSLDWPAEGLTDPKSRHQTCQCFGRLRPDFWRNCTYVTRIPTGTALASPLGMSPRVSTNPPSYDISQTEKGWLLVIQNEHCSVMQVFRSAEPRAMPLAA